MKLLKLLNVPRIVKHMKLVKKNMLRGLLLGSAACTEDSGKKHMLKGTRWCWQLCDRAVHNGVFWSSVSFHAPLPFSIVTRPPFPSRFARGFGVSLAFSTRSHFLRIFYALGAGRGQ